MFSKTPTELISKEISNKYNKCQSIYELVTNRRYNESLAILTAAETYAIAEKAYLRCDTFTELQTKEVEDYVNTFDDYYFSLKQVLFHDDDDYEVLRIKLRAMREAYEELNHSFNLF